MLRLRLPRTSAYQSETTQELERLVAVWTAHSVPDPARGCWDNSAPFIHKLKLVKAELAFREANPGVYEAEQARDAIGKKFGW